MYNKISYLEVKMTFVFSWIAMNDIFDYGGVVVAQCRGGRGAGLQKVASGASAASGQTQISWTNFDQNHVYFVQALHGNCGKRYLTQTKGVLDSIFST